MSIFWILFLSLLAAGAQSLLYSWRGLKRVEYTRHFSRDAVYEGETVGLVEIIRNRKLLPLPWIRAESRISPYLRFSGRGGEEREIAADTYHRSVFYLGAFSQITRRHEITCLKRGHYEAGSVALTGGDLFGLSVHTKQLSLNCALDVYPRLLSEDELNTPSTRWQGEMTVRRWIMPDPFLFAGIRDYRAGDAMRDIHWRATARTGRLEVKVRDYTADPKVLVALNVQNSEEQWGELMDYEQEGIEQGIRIAATLCVRALEAGVEAGFACNGCLSGEHNTGKTVVIPAQRTREHAETLLGAMARLEVRREATFPTFLESLVGVTNADILVLSTYQSEAIARAMRVLEDAGNSVSFMALERGTSRAKAG